jgi:predicted TIM-barrel fold metal-dependent hydrolase
MHVRTLFCLAILGATACASAPGAQPPIVPVVEYHAHLLSPVAAVMANEPPLPAIETRSELVPLLRAMEQGWNDRAALAALFTEDAVTLNQGNADLQTWIRGRDAVAEYLSTRFSRAYRITPVAATVDGSSAQLAGYFTRGEGATLKHFGHVFLSLRKERDGVWRIAGVTPAFPGPPVRDPITADQLIQQLDDAGIRRGVVLSVAYWFRDDYEKVRAENDWTVQQVARFPDRLVAFCGVSPITDGAVAEIARCATLPGVKGVKLHFGNSYVDLRKPEHVEQVRRVFRAANEHRLAIVAHLWTDPEYETHGGEDAKIVLEQLLPAAPDVPVQIAHMAGGGRSTPAALAVFADAIAAKDPRTRNLYFDVATMTAGATPEALRQDAAQMRRIGFHRILYGTDMGPPAAGPSWQTFRVLMPLTDDELRVIAGNVLPYLR